MMHGPSSSSSSRSSSSSSGSGYSGLAAGLEKSMWTRPLPGVGTSVSQGRVTKGVGGTTPKAAAAGAKPPLQTKPPVTARGAERAEGGRPQATGRPRTTGKPQVAAEAVPTRGREAPAPARVNRPQAAQSLVPSGLSKDELMAYRDASLYKAERLREETQKIRAARASGNRGAMLVAKERIDWLIGMDGHDLLDWWLGGEREDMSGSWTGRSRGN
jgi:hypothetical protein